MQWTTALLEQALALGGNLWDADLRGADLRGSDLRGADLMGADLRGADLREAYLREADLCEANLRGANLRGADLCEANLRGANLSHFQICPEIGSFIGFKKLRHIDDTTEIAALLIPDDAKRTSSLVGRKCRAERVRVLSGSGHSPTAGQNGIDGKILEYREGDLIEADSFDDDIRVECSHGIHFYMTQKEVEEH